MSTIAATNNAVAQSYDDIPYESFPFPQTHPPHISTVASLFGLSPPDFKTARVLEIGCSRGDNLLPLALLYPQAHFTGFDLSEGQIAEAKRQQDILKVSNIEFLQQDILTFDTKAHAKKFDYIICHGVFSWVPKFVQEKIAPLCNELLTPQGLVVISYNTLPGWNALRSLREMIHYHTRGFARAGEKLQHAKSFLEFLSAHIPKNIPVHRANIEELRERLKSAPDSYLYHEYLEEANIQVYFSDFMNMVQPHDLQYVGDTDISSMHYGALLAEDVAAVKTLENAKTDIITQEQYMDFLTNRRFRNTILCRSAQKIDRNPKNERIMDYSLTLAPGLTVSGADPSQQVIFKKPDGRSFSTRNEVSGALFLELHACEQMPLPANTLVTRAQKRLKLDQPDTVLAALIEHGMNLVRSGYIHLHAETPPHVTAVSEKPMAFPIARLHAAKEGLGIAMNVLSQAVPNVGFEKLILRQLDGTKTVSDVTDVLVAHVQKALKDGTMKLNRADGNPVRNAVEVRPSLVTTVEQTLLKLAKSGLLVG